MNLKTASATILFFSALSTAALAAPVMVVEHPVHNFGSISEGTKIDHVFTIRNGGDSSLNIIKVRPSCGCTAANVSSPTIPPGKTGEIKATFNSTNFSGAMTKTISVDTNDPKTPTVTLTMKGMVTSDLQITPKQLNFGQVKIGKTETQSVIIENHGRKPLKILSVKTPMPQVSLRNDKQTLKRGESAKVEVSVTPRSQDRILSGYLTISTDHPSKGDISVPIYGSPVK